MLTKWVIVGVNLHTLIAWDEKVHRLYPDAQEHLETLRKQRGHWKEDPIVYGLVNRSRAVEEA